MYSGKILIWVKLSNYGDVLKLLSLNYSRKAISGWSNDPCIGTVQKMSENEMDNRVSKSGFIIILIIVLFLINSLYFIPMDFY